MSRLLILCIALLSCRNSDKDESQDLTDSAGSSEETGTSHTNTPAVVDQVVLTPDPVATNDVLVANVEVSDADNDTVSLDYVWYVDSVVIDDAGAELSGEIYFEKGDAISVAVTPHDGVEFGASVSVGPVTVSNTPPTAPEISIVDGGELLGLIDTLSEDADGDSITYTFAWTVDGTSYGDATTTTESGDTVPLADTDGAQTWTLTVTPFDGEAEGEPGTASVVLEARSCAIQFDSQSSVLWFETANFGIGQDDFTLELWIAPGDVLGDQGTLFRTSEGSNQVMAVSVGTDDSEVMQLDTVLSQADNYCSEPNDGPDASIPRDGTWHHIAIVRSGATLYTFLDGDLITTGDLSWSGCNCGSSRTPCIAESGSGLFGRNAPEGVALGPMRFARGAAYTAEFEPAKNWSIDGQSIAQWNTEQCFDGENLPDSAGGDNTGSSPTDISAVEGP